MDGKDIFISVYRLQIFFARPLKYCFRYYFVDSRPAIIYLMKVSTITRHQQSAFFDITKLILNMSLSLSIQETSKIAIVWIHISLPFRTSLIFFYNYSKDTKLLNLHQSKRHVACNWRKMKRLGAKTPAKKNKTTNRKLNKSRPVPGWMRSHVRTILEYYFGGRSITQDSKFPARLQF